MKRTVLCPVIMLSVVAFAVARTTELTLHAPKASESTKNYTLLPKADEQTDADAAPLYEKAVQSFPDNLQMEEIDQWLKTPPEELPRKEVQAVLEKLEPAFKLLDQAAKCKQCDWPYLYDNEIMEYVRKHRRLTSFLALKMRFQIALGRYDDAIDTAQTGLAAAKHFSEGSPPLHGMFGIAIGVYVCRQLEAFAQRSDAPNLYQALQDLPQPFIDLTKKVEWESPEIKGRVHLLMNRLGRHVAVLQCIEAMRLYAATHEGRFPKQLSEITQVPVPDDPVTHKPFIYSRTGAEAVLEGPAPEGAEAQEAVRYELHLKE